MVWRYLPNRDMYDSFDYSYFYNNIEIPNYPYANEEITKKNTNRIRVVDPNDGFSYGNCAVKAITRAFRINQYLTREIFTLMGVDFNDGCTWRQCNKCIESLCRIQGKVCKYHTNRNHISFTKFYKSHKKGKYLLNFPIHLSYLSGGTMYDSFMDDESFRTSKLMGWWQII